MPPLVVWLLSLFLWTAIIYLASLAFDLQAVKQPAASVGILAFVALLIAGIVQWREL